MTRRHLLAVALTIVSFAVVLAQPLWIRVTGEEVTVAVRPVDPLSFFRGNYMDVRYGVDLAGGFGVSPPNVTVLDAPAGLDDHGKLAVFVRFVKGRPATPVAVTTVRPDLGPDEFCIRAQASSGGLSFPAIEQLFVTPERARVIEDRFDNSVAVLRVTPGCRAQIVDIEPR